MTYIEKVQRDRHVAPVRGHSEARRVCFARNACTPIGIRFDNSEHPPGDRVREGVALYPGNFTHPAG